MFIISLAVSDLVVGAIVMPISVVYIFTVDWLFGVAVCQIWIAVDYTASTASILNLFILSLDRYWSVTSPLKYMRKRTKKRAKRMISVVWCSSALWIIPVVGWHYFANNGIRTVPDDTCDTEYASNLTFKVVTAIFNFYLPLAVMYMLYGKVFHEIRKRSKLEIGQTNRSVYNNRPRTSLPVTDDSDHKNSTFGDEETPPSDNIDVIGYSRNSHHVSNHEKPDQNTYQMDYVYDERVADSTTERLDRYVISRREKVPPRSSTPTDVKISCVETSITELATISPLLDKRSKHGLKHKIFNRYKKQYRPNGKHRKLNYTFPKSDTGAVLTGVNSIVENRLTNSTPGVLLRAINKGEPARDSPCVKGNNSVVNAPRNRPLANFRDRMNVLNRSTQLSKEIKAARQLGVIMGAFTVCFVPYFILFLYVGFCEDCIDVNVMTAMTWIGYLNSTLNPCLYPLCNANFRRKFRKMFNFRAENQGQNAIERNSYVSARFD